MSKQNSKNERGREGKMKKQKLYLKPSNRLTGKEYLKKKKKNLPENKV